MIDSEDLDRIIEHMRKLFVTRDECNNRMEQINNKLSSLTTESALMKQTLDRISRGIWWTIGLIIAAIVAAIMNLVIRT